MLAIHKFSQKTKIQVLGVAPVLSNELETEIERLWQAAQSRQDNALLKGLILSATDIELERIVCHIVEYRRFIAQMASPDLFDALRVQPLAVSGILICADGIVFGRRAASTTQDAGLWELVPSGGIDAGEVNEEGQVDFLAQILNELREETGIDQDKVAKVMPFCLIEDRISHVLDIGIILEVPTLSFEAVYQIHREAGSGEYDELKIVPRRDLTEFIERTGSQLVSVSSELLRVFQLAC